MKSASLMLVKEAQTASRAKHDYGHGVSLSPVQAFSEIINGGQMGRAPCR